MTDTIDTPETAAPEAKKKSVDLSQFDTLASAQEAGISVPIMDPRGEDTGIIIVVAGPDSDRQRKALQKQVDERLRRRNSKPMTGAEVTEGSVRVLAQSVIGWNNVQIGDNVIEFSVDAAVSLFQRFPWIREQVEAAAGDRAAFLKS